MSNYINALNHEWEKLEKLCPFDISDRLEVEYDKTQNKFIISYFNQYYIVDIHNKVIVNKDSKEQLEIIDSIIILNYLTYSSFHIPVTSKWLSLKDIANGGALFYPAFYKSSISNITTTFGNSIDDFEDISLELNAKPIKFGDKGFVFDVLPKIKIGIIVWGGDEDMTPSSSVLFESSIQHLLHIETIIGVGMNLVQRIIDAYNIKNQTKTNF